MSEFVKPTLNIVTLGCSKNLVDSEHLAGRLAAAGYEPVFDSNSTAARIVVVNTCGFIGDAKEESINTILDFAAAKERGDVERLYVIGCLSERYADELRAEIPEVDSFFGARTLDGILDELTGLKPGNERKAHYPSDEANGNKSIESPSYRGLTPPEFIDKTLAGGGKEIPCEPLSPSQDTCGDGRRTVAEKMLPSVKTDGSYSHNLLPGFSPVHRILSTPSHYAYLKISEGCDRRCGFCAIPLIRGGHVSVPVEELVLEAESLATQGVKELIVIGQDTTCYGLDLYGERRLAELLRRLARIEGIEWIRLHYAYPAGFPQDVIEVMRDEPKICKYLDIPLQHISDSQLRSMKRGLGGEDTRKLIAGLRSEIPGLALRTTLLVGYPGETERDFDELLEFVRWARFERLGVFPYSEEEGTYSAEKLADNVPEEEKRRRADRVMELQAEISTEHNVRRIGGAERVMIDRREGDLWICRSQWDSPEVDTEILVASDEQLHPGDFITVRITDASEYDLAAGTIEN